MGIRQIYLEHLEKCGLLNVPDLNLLDIGAQNAYLFTHEYVTNFLVSRGIEAIEASRFATYFSAGGAIDPNGGFKSEVYLGELFKKAGLRYTSMDVFERPDNIVVNLNEFRVPRVMAGTYNVVLNFGTTEHVFDQRNCFKVIHECTSVGGYMFHQVPSIGCVDHSLFVYSPIMFANLAEYNDYELIEIWYSGPYGGASPFATLRNLSYINKLNGRDTFRDATLPDNGVEGLETANVIDATINVLFRKRVDTSFRLPLDLSGAAGPMMAAQDEDAQAAYLADVPHALLLAELERRLTAR